MITHTCVPKMLPDPTALVVGPPRRMCAICRADMPATPEARTQPPRTCRTTRALRALTGVGPR